MSFSGIGSIMQNIAPLMSEVGLKLDAGFQAAIAICAQFFSCFLSSILIDKLGFKFLWNLSSAGSALSLLLYGLNVKFKWSKILPVIFLFSFQFFFNIGQISFIKIFKKINESIIVTISFNDEHKSNCSDLIKVTISFNDEHSLKVKFPIEFTEEVIFISFNDEYRVSRCSELNMLSLLFTYHIKWSPQFFTIGRIFKSRNHLCVWNTQSLHDC